MTKYNDIEKLNDAKYIALGVGVAALILVAVVYFNAGSAVENPEEPETFQPQPAEASDEIPEGYVRRLSDGQIILPEEQPERLYAVMIENSSEAWPLSGLSKARLVFEAPVEGSIPRFMAVFDDKQEIDSIGPVRSARPYYIDWARGLGAMYVHCGGSPQALEILRDPSIKSLNQFFFSMFFWRSTSRYAPHNLFTSIYELGQGFGYKHYEKEELHSFKYVSISENKIDELNQTISVSFSGNSRQYDAVWKYDSEKNDYVRWQGSSRQYDADGSEVRAANVVVVSTEIHIIDEVGRRSLITAGSGEAVLFRGGRQYNVEWSKESEDEPLRFLTDSGNEAAFFPGPTWIEVVPLSTAVIVEE